MVVTKMYPAIRFWVSKSVYTPTKQCTLLDDVTDVYIQNTVHVMFFPAKRCVDMVNLGVLPHHAYLTIFWFLNHDQLWVN